MQRKLKKHPNQLGLICQTYDMNYETRVTYKNKNKINYEILILINSLLDDKIFFFKKIT
jgi:hypothetical protein